MFCKCGAKLEICLTEGELGERADAEGRRSRRRGRVDAEGRRVGGSDCRCSLHYLSVCAARHLLSLLEVAVELFESGVPLHGIAHIVGHDGRKCHDKRRRAPCCCVTSNPLLLSSMHAEDDTIQRLLRRHSHSSHWLVPASRLYLNVREFVVHVGGERWGKALRILVPCSTYLLLISKVVFRNPCKPTSD